MQQRTQDRHRLLAEVRVHGRDVQPSQDVAVRATDLAPTGDDPTCEHRVLEAKLAQGAHRVRRKQQREPQLSRALRTLKDLNVPTGVTQRQPRGKATNARTDNERTPTRSTHNCNTAF